MRNAREGRGWPGYILGGRLRTSTAALLIAFFGIWWLYETYEPPPAPPEQIPASEVVPPGFIPDPAYTWAPRTDVQPRVTTPTTTTTTTTPTTPTTPTTTGSVPPGEEPTPGPTTTGAEPSPTPPTASTPVSPEPAVTTSVPVPTGSSAPATPPTP